MTNDISAAIAPPPGEGWVLLPAAKPRRTGLLGALRGPDKDEDLTEWAATTAAGLPGPKDYPALLDTYAEMLADLAASARQRNLLLGYVWLPGSTGPVAQIDVVMLGVTQAGPGLTLDMLEKQRLGRPEPGAIAFEASRVQLEAGPALRTRQVWEAVPGSPADTAVTVTYACLPPEAEDAVMFTMTWTLPDDTPAMTETADRLAATLRVTT